MMRADRWRARREFCAAAVILKSDTYVDTDEGSGVEFRLTYEGLLHATQRDPVQNQRDPRADHKREIRRIFHLQLRRLWEVNPYLKHGYPVTFDWKSQSVPKSAVTHGCGIAEFLAPLYKRSGYECVPLVREELGLVCSLSIIFLRPDAPGSVLASGDIDNRLKTLFDALRLPKGTQELVGYESPRNDERPFFCLLEDDSLITHVSVETDTLLQPTGNASNVNDTRLMIHVKLRPYVVNPSNENFG